LNFYNLYYGCKKKRKKKEKNIVKVNVCVCICFMDFFYDKIAKNKEEFNILICSWSRIMNLHVSCIFNIQ